uniref:Mitochondrial ribosome associated GTPase 2 n=1 Tax=Chelonoidis abingdonii TaxID=106734 RepID=A0A8C0GBN9_CHEAB
MLGSKILPSRTWALLDGLRQWKPAYSPHIQICLLQQQFKSWQRILSTSGAKCAKNQRLKQKRAISEKKLTRYFVDHRRVCVTGGRGGQGINSFYSEPRKEFGGPDGGNGGDGGHVILKADQQIKSLASVLSLYRGFDGERGRSKNCYGATGGYTYIKVRYCFKVSVHSIWASSHTAMTKLLCSHCSHTRTSLKQHAASR